jgi:hypothetical protein
MVMTSDAAEAVKEPLRAVAEEYEGADAEKLASYAGVLATYGLSVAGFSLFLRRRGNRLPTRVDPVDVVLLGTATFKLSRLISRDAVTGVLRAPFTRRKGRGKGAEVLDVPRGLGARRAVGELLTCPFCVSQWLATALGGAFVVAPDATRMAAATLTAVTVADVLQYAHTALQKTAD